MQFLNKKLSKNLKNNPYLSIKFLYLVLASTLTILLFSINFASRQDRVLSASTNEKGYLSYQKKYWQNFLYNNPEYLEGWVELSLIEAKLGQFEEAYYSINSALEIDPNSKEANVVEKSIGAKFGSDSYNSIQKNHRQSP